MATPLEQLMGVAPKAPQQSELEALMGVAKAAPQESPVEDTIAPPQQSAQSTVSDDAWQQVSDPDSVSSAIGRGVDTLQANFGGTLEAIGEASGSEYLAQLGANYRAEQQAEAEKYGTPRVGSYTDISSDNLAGDVGSYLKNLGLGALPSAGTLAAGGAAGAQVGSTLGGPGRLFGGAIGAMLAGLGINIGDVQNQIKEIDPDAKSPWLAIGAGGVMAPLDAIGMSSMVKPFIRQFGKEYTYEMLTQSGIAKELAADVVKGAVGEGSTSAAQSVIGNVAAAEGAGVEANVDQIVENAINSAVGGTALGGSVGAVGGAINAKSRMDEVTQASPQAQFEQGTTEAPGTAKRIFEGIAGKSTDPLRPLARVSESAKEFIRQFTPDETGAEASGKTVFEDADLRVGKWNKEIDDAEAEFSGNKDDFYKAMADDQFRNSLPEADQVAVNKARDTMDNILGDARKAGLEVGKIKDYLPVRLDESKVGTPEFWQAIRPYYKSAADVDAAVANYQTLIARPKTETPSISRLVQQDPITGQYTIEPKSQKGGPDTMKFKFGQGTIPPEFGHLEKSRSFGAVPQSVLLQFSDVANPSVVQGVTSSLGSRVRTAIRDYTEGAAHRIAFAERFGGTGEKANAMIAKAVKEAQDKGRPVDKAEVDRMYDILDAYNGMYQRIKDPNIKTAQSTLSTFLTVKTLPLSTLASIAELANPAIRGDVSAALATLWPTFKEAAAAGKRAVLGGRPKSEFAQAAAEANLTMASALNVAAARLGDSVIGKTSAKINRFFFVANLNSFLTHFNRIYAAKTAEYIIDKNLHALASGLPIGSAKGQYYATQLRSMGIPITTNAEAMAYYSPTTKSLSSAGRAYKILGMRRFADQTVLEPNIGNTPLWMNSGQLHLLAMLKRYPAAFTNTVLPALFRKGAPSWAGSGSRAGFGAVGALGLLAFVIGVGYVQDELKLVAKTGEWNPDDERTPEQQFMDVLNNTVMPLQVSLGMDFVAAPRYGSDPISSLAGPAAGFATQTVGVIHSYLKEPKEGKIAQYLYKQTPFQFYRPGREEALEYGD